MTCTEATISEPGPILLVSTEISTALSTTGIKKKTRSVTQSRTKLSPTSDVIGCTFSNEITVSGKNYHYLGSIMHDGAAGIGHFWTIVKHGSELWRHGVGTLGKDQAKLVGLADEEYRIGMFEENRDSTTCLHVYSATS